LRAKSLNVERITGAKPGRFAKVLKDMTMNAIGNPMGVQREQTMEEILASIRKIIESNEEMANAADATVAKSTHTPKSSPIVEADQTNVLELTAVNHGAVSEPVEVATSTSLSAAVLDEAPIVEAQETVVAAPAPTLQSEMARLVSRSAEKQVAASFDDLNSAFVKARELPLQAMAENMLRPMLNEWLDNNLPNMVERLVREEISRIARGDV
jgi:uncharacterized protein